MTDYKMTVEIPITNVPEDISVQEAKVTAEIWHRGGKYESNTDS